MIKVTKALKKKNARLTPENRLRVFKDAVRNDFASFATGNYFNGDISIFSFINKSGLPAVDVTFFSDREKRYTIDVAKALGFKPRW